MSTFLITEVAGFVGCNLARALLAMGERVRGVDNFATGRRCNLEGLAGLDFIEGDIQSPGLLDEALEGVDYVLHQAALPSVPRSVADPVATHRANVDATLALLEAVRRRGRIERVVYAGSSSVYGSLATLPKVETLPTEPLSPYAASKLAAEHCCRVYARLFGVPCVVLRYFNVFGPHQDPHSPYAAVIPRFIGRMLRDESPIIFGDGEQTRDFTHVDNVVEANLKACGSDAAVGEVFNIACGTSVSLLEVIDNINRLLGKTLSPVFLPARSGDVRHSRADVTKARRQLGYSGRVSFREGLASTLAWYRGFYRESR